MTDQLTSLRASVAARDALDEVISHQVIECRRVGCSWNEIAEITGISKPTAMKRWKEADDMATTASSGLAESTIWSITEGDRLRRREVHRMYGGNIQSGISPSRSSDEILLFSSPRGAEHGYSDGPSGNGTTYQYTGEGQRGDQSMTRGNRAIRDHRDNHKHLRLFEGEGDGWVTYLGEYEYDTHTTRTIPGTGTSGQRAGILFNLRKV